MKNIHILKTNNPSKLFKLCNELHLDKKDGTDHKRNQYIYITNDDKIKHNDWILLYDGRVVKAQTVREDSIWFNDGLETMPKYCKKIILTTDQDLIEDGVQPIPDEFLEWFVKNPSCEVVEIKGIVKHSGGEFIPDYYKIIIPSEESKQETLEEAAERIFTPSYTNYKVRRQGFIEGAKWKAKTTYSEQEVKHIISEALQSALVNVNLDGWFEQFKKK